MNSARAFCPANISLIFSIYEGADPRTKGSLGVGCTLDKGVHVEVKRSEKKEIIVDGKKTSFPTVEYVIDKITDTPVSVEIKNEVPFGCGFGMSGASALGTAYALNSLLNSGWSDEKLALLAHEAEVMNKTGLGDIAGQYTGGMMIREKKGDPLYVQRIPIREEEIFYRSFAAIDTSTIISDEKKKDRINRAGNAALKKIIESGSSLSSILCISKEFAVESELLQSKKILKLLEQIESNGGKGSMIMLGESVVADIAFEGSVKARIVPRGAHVL